jgi:hypothetical protein
VLRTRRRISSQPPDWALSTEGIRTLRQTSDISSVGAEAVEPAGTVRQVTAIDLEGEGEDVDDIENLPGIMQPSMRFSPDRRRQSRTQHGPAGVAAKRKIR